MNNGFVVGEYREKATNEEISEMYDRIVNGPKFTIKSRVVFCAEFSVLEKTFERLWHSIVDLL